MTLDEVYKILKPARIDPEDPDYEEVSYNGNKSEIKYAIDNGLLKLEDLSDTILYNWINDGISDENLLAKITQHRKEKKEEAKLQDKNESRSSYENDEYDKYDEYEEYDEYDDGLEEENYEKIMEEYRNAMQAHEEELKKAAEQSILPQNANIKQTWASRIKKFLKEKTETLKNHFQEKLER